MLNLLGCAMDGPGALSWVVLRLLLELSILWMIHQKPAFAIALDDFPEQLVACFGLVKRLLNC